MKWYHLFFHLNALLLHYHLMVLCVIRACVNEKGLPENRRLETDIDDLKQKWHNFGNTVEALLTSMLRIFPEVPPPTQDKPAAESVVWCPLLA